MMRSVLSVRLALVVTVKMLGTARNALRIRSRKPTDVRFVSGLELVGVLLATHMTLAQLVGLVRHRLRLQLPHPPHRLCL